MFGTLFKVSNFNYFHFLIWRCEQSINLLLTERKGRTGKYWPEVVAVRAERSEVRTKTTEGQYSPVRLELARLVSSLLYCTRAMLVLNLPAFKNKKYAAYDRFHGNGPYGEILTKKEPIKTLGFTSRLPCHIINIYILCVYKAAKTEEST